MNKFDFKQMKIVRHFAEKSDKNIGHEISGNCYECDECDGCDHCDNCDECDECDGCDHCDSISCDYGCS